MDIVSYILSKKYVEDSLAGAGALAGKSAYEIATDNGFQGGPTEWLESLKGDTPQIGPNGTWVISDVDTGVIASPSLAGYATEEFVLQQIKDIDFPETDLSAYATREELNEAILGIVIPDVSEFVTKEYVAQKIAEAELADKEVDLSSYYTKTETDEKIADAINELGLPNYVTEEELQQALNEIQIPSVDGLASEEYVQEQIAQIQIPSTEGLATEQYVDESIAAIDLSKYATKDEIPSTEGFATEEYVKTRISNLINSAPETLDTLGELAAALEENQEVVDILNASITNKQNKNVIVYKDSSTGKASMTAPEVMEKVRAGENVYYTPNLTGGTLHPYLEGADTSVFFYSNYIDNDRVIGTGILISADGTITTETYQLGHLTDTEVHITSVERNRWNDTYTKTEVDNLLETKAEESVKKYFLIIETTQQNGDYLLDGITFDEIYEKFNAGNVNMVCHVDGTDYIPLLSVTRSSIIFSGIYNTTSVSLVFNNEGVGTLTSTYLAENSKFSSYYTKTETDTKIANLVNSAYDAIILKSSTPGSTKKFQLTIDDDGVLSAEEVIEQ